MKPRVPRGLRPDEQELWDKVRKNTVPIQSSPRSVIIDAVKQIDRPIVQYQVPRFEIGSAAKPNQYTNKSTVGLVTMDPKNYGRLKKGRLSPDSTIDLHGMTLEQAHPALIGFILRAHQRAHRLVLVITGKGKPKQNPDGFPARIGVLKHQVPHWLMDDPIGQLVLQTKSAHGKHGGEGALYVYLRRRR